MVSKASEDLPEPDRPVNTTNWSRGMATSIFLRLCSRAPRIEIVRESAGFFLEVSFMEPLRARPSAAAHGSERSENGTVSPAPAAVMGIMLISPPTGDSHHAFARQD